MKFLLKLFGGLVAVVIILTALFLFWNQQDEDLKPTTLAMLTPIPESDGFDLRRLRGREDSRPAQLEFQDLNEYLLHRTELTQKLSENRKYLDLVLEAYEIGKIKVSRNSTDLSGLGFYSINLHRLALAQILETFLSGRKIEAVEALRKSNSFLVNLIETPTTAAQLMSALRCLENNLNITKELQAKGILKSIPPDLAQSFRINQSTEAIITEHLRFEYLFVAEVLQSARDFPILERFGNPLSAGAIAGLVTRPNQSLNWLSQIHSEVLGPTCRKQPADLCSPTYVNEIATKSVAHAIDNPGGRGYIQTLTMWIWRLPSEIESSIDNINAQLATLTAAAADSSGASE